MHRRPPTPRPNFFWQGLLIILPASLLAAIGLFSLRQDRILAEHEAMAQARRIAGDLASHQIPTAVRANVILPAEVAGFRAAPSRPASDPILICLQGEGSWLACLLSSTGDLIYPPPYAALPLPLPLDENELSDAQKLFWTALRSPGLAEANPAEAALACQSFLQSQPPERFAAAATYRWADFLRSQGDVAQAWRLFETLAREAGPIAGETGLSLGLCAQFQLLQLADALQEAKALKAELVA